MKPDSPVLISIIIVNWNTRDLLAACLHSVAAASVITGDPSLSEQHTLIDGTTAQCIVAPHAPVQAAPNLPRVEVLVVDNASSDGSAEMVRAEFPWVRLITNQSNVGFARANNQAIRICAGRYVLLLNSDTVVHHAALAALVEFMDAQPTVGAAGALLLNPDGTLQPSCSPFPTLLREAWRMFALDRVVPIATYQMTRWDGATPRAVDVLLGACMNMRRESLDQVGLLDETYFMYSEEVDLCLRIKRAGWQIFWVPQAHITHYGGQSSKQAAKKMFLHLYQSKTLYFRKHHGRHAARLYKGILVAAALLRLVSSPLILLESREQQQVHWSLAKNYWALLRCLPSF